LKLLKGTTMMQGENSASVMFRFSNLICVALFVFTVYPINAQNLPQLRDGDTVQLDGVLKMRIGRGHKWFTVTTDRPYQVMFDESPVVTREIAFSIEGEDAELKKHLRANASS